MKTNLLMLSNKFKKDSPTPIELRTVKEILKRFKQIRAQLPVPKKATKKQSKKRNENTLIGEALREISVARGLEGHLNSRSQEH